MDHPRAVARLLQWYGQRVIRKPEGRETDRHQLPGSYTQYCDLSRQYDPEPYPNTTNGEPDGTPVPPYKGKPIDRWFEPNGKTDLLEYMKKRWVGLGQPSWILWAHEYSKHATCFSTFQEECYVSPAAVARERGGAETHGTHIRAGAQDAQV